MSLRGKIALFPLAHHRPGHAHADKVQSDQHKHEEHHAEGIGGRRQDGRENGDYEQGVAEISDQELRSDDTEKGQKENEHGEFEDEAKTEKDEKNQVEILVDVDEWDDRALKADQEAQDVRERNKIAEGDASKEKENG